MVAAEPEGLAEEVFAEPKGLPDFFEEPNKLPDLEAEGLADPEGCTDPEGLADPEGCTAAVFRRITYINTRCPERIQDSVLYYLITIPSCSRCSPSP